jgi:hypothetical protein
MTVNGRCHCGAISYQASGEPAYEALCHCGDCRRHAGAPMVGWAAYPATAVTVAGTPRVYHSSEHGRRHFCGECGTGLFYSNQALLPGLLDIQSCTFDDPAARPPHIHVQTAERLGWMDDLDAMPKFERFPSQA